MPSIFYIRTLHVYRFLEPELHFAHKPESAYQHGKFCLDITVGQHNACLYTNKICPETVWLSNVISSPVAYAYMPKLATMILLSVATIYTCKNFTKFAQNYAFNHLCIH